MLQEKKGRMKRQTTKNIWMGHLAQGQCRKGGQRDALPFHLHLKQVATQRQDSLV